ncbi:MAG: SpoIIIAH-like family protein [Clostridia bacterium]|nr:SpoIIIAH-like family protein [Clostridia bacterium]
MKSKTKKIIVLSVMVLLLVATGVLNFVLSDKLTAATESSKNANTDNVTQTFFAAAKSDRESTRESEFLYLDAIVNSETATASAKENAEKQKADIVSRMEQELALETLVKAKGFGDAIVTIGDGGVSIVVGSQELTAEQANQILAAVVAETTFKATEVKIIPYN